MATPNGYCYCDCGGHTRPGSFFLQGHDKRAEKYLLAIDGTQSIADRLSTRHYIPGESGMSLRAATLEADSSYEECGLKLPDGTDCRVIGRGIGMRKHRASDSDHI